jgi:hypothetical protein
MTTISSGKDVDNATNKKLRTDFLNLNFSEIITKFESAIPLDPARNTMPATSSRKDNQIICVHL